MPRRRADAISGDWAHDRMDMYRTFEIECYDGSVLRVAAHFWSGDNADGHAMFYDITPDGRNVVPIAVNSRHWKVVREVTPPQTLRYITDAYLRAQAAQTGQVAFEQTAKKPSRLVH